MGKKSTASSGNREAKVAKAGKRSGQTVWPAPISSERRAAKEQGEQQFVSKEPLSIKREVTIIKHDGRDMFYATKTISSSAEFVFDASRGRVVYDPSFKEKSNK